MSSTIGCEDTEQLIAYLYEEDSPAERAAMERHLQACPACADEVRSLQRVRHELAEWQPPAANTHFRLARVPDVRRPLWRQPAWGFAAAATLVLAVGAAIANLDIRVGNGEILIRTGWGVSAPAVASRVAGSQAVVTTTSARAARDAEWQAALKDVEARLRSEMSQARPAAAHPAAAGDVASRDTLLREVRALIGESEKRQERLLAMRMTDIVQDVEAQRRADLVRIEQNMGQIEGLTGAEAARQRELLNYLVRVSQRR